MKKLAGDIIILHKYTKNHNHMRYSSWDMEWGKEFFGILVHFLPFFAILPIRKKPIDIIILYMCAINENHMMCVSLDMECNRQNFFLILDHFLPFNPTNNPKNQTFWTHKRTPGDIIILHKCTENHDHMLYCSWDMVHHRCNCYFSFWSAFCPFTSLTARKSKLKKKLKKSPEDIIILQ